MDPPPQPDECGNLPRSPEPSGNTGLVPAASRKWQQPKELGPFQGDWAKGMTFALDREGYGMALWNNGYEGWAVAHAPSSGFGAPFKIADKSVFLLDVAMDGHGGGVGAWNITGGLVAASFASASFMAPTSLSSSDSINDFSLATSGKDNAIVVWPSSTAGLMFSERRGTTWSASVALMADGAPASGNDSKLLLDDSGNGLLLFDTPTLKAMRVNYGCEATTFSALPDLNAAPSRSISARMNHQGQAIVAWAEAGDDANTNRGLNLRMFDPSSGFGDVFRIDSGASGISSPSVAIGDDGSAAVVWVQRGQLWEVWARRFLPASGWSDAVRLDAKADGNPRVAIGGDGTTVALWQSGSGSLFQLDAAVALPGSDWGTATPVSEQLDCNSTTCQPTIDWDANVALDRYGRAVVIWIAPANDVVRTNSFR